ncbi:hypothetical protein ACE7GA_25060 [Roseomonas sp. CCTCC AB2023176]|uniref:hypothetical protein n=1 Tax=Roseomonas sp. CCTCC AB2023176 TaxID=3342640 RepID=UPI0035D913CC
MIGSVTVGTALRARLLWLWPLLLLPMFYQLPYYKRDLGPVYLLSKVWPIVVLPLVLYGMLALRLPRAALYTGFLAYALLVTPALSLVYLPNDVLDAVISTVRAWPMVFYFAVPAALVLLRPSEVSFRRALLGLGMATFPAMWLLWVTVPLAWYDAVGSLFSWDEGRDYFIRMPMSLGYVAVFYLGRRFAMERRLWQPALILAAIVSLALIFKARFPTSVTVLILLLAPFFALPGRWRLALAALAALPAGAAAMIYGPGVPDMLGRIFDASLFIRIRSFGIAFDWMFQHPLRLIFGTGSISTESAVTMADVVGYADFWLTDIGWVGVLMEYGVVGTAFVAMIYFRAWSDLRALAGADPFRRALLDFVLLEILVSGIYSVMFAPGPVVTCAAIAWWLAARDRAGIRADESVSLPSHSDAAPATAPSWAEGQVTLPAGPPPYAAARTA